MSAWLDLKYFLATLLFSSLFLVEAYTDGVSYRKQLVKKAESAGRCASSAANIAIISDLAEPCSTQPSKMAQLFTAKQLEWIYSLSPVLSMADRTPLVRKDVRLLTKTERHRFQQVLVDMKTKYFVDGTSEYEIFEKMHNLGIAVGPSAGVSSDANFYVWHRAATLYMESAIQSHDPTVPFPMWDVMLDVYLPEMRDSIIWSDEFYGNCGLYGLQPVITPITGLGSESDSVVVQTGPFSFWEKQSLCFTDTEKGGAYKYLSRTCNSDHAVGNSSGSASILTSFTSKEIQAILKYTSLKDLAGTACVEDDHIKIHWYIDGDMTTHCKNGCCAVTEPITWSLHAFADYLYELFRLLSQQTDRGTEFPTYNQTQYCYEGAGQMLPFNLQLIDGVSTDFTSRTYVYERTPATCDSDVECGNEEFIWCDNDLRKCKSKMHFGASCFGHPAKACYSGVCNNGTCF